MKVFKGKSYLGNDPEIHEVLKNLDPFERSKWFRSTFLDNPAEFPGSGWSMYQSQIRIARELGIINYEDDFFAQRAEKGQQSYVPFETYVRTDEYGEPYLDIENPQIHRALVTVPSMDSSISLVMRDAYETNLDILKERAVGRPETLSRRFTPSKEGIVSDIDKASLEAWQLVSPAFSHLYGTEQGTYKGNKSIDMAHKDFIQRYIYSYYNLQGDVLDAQTVIDQLYLGTNWLVNIPNMPGMKRFIPKRIPFSFASGLDNEDIEYFMDVWGKHGVQFKDYIKNKIKEDDGSVQVYVDVSRSGAGLSYYFLREGSLIGEEDPSTLISWSEFGDFMEKKYSFNILLDVYNTFREIPYEPVFDVAGVPIYDPRRMFGIFNESVYDKWLDIIKETEDDIRTDSNKIKMFNSWVDNAFHNSADGVLGLRRRPSDLTELRQIGDFSGEWNWLLAWLGVESEIGEVERQTLVKFFSKVDSNTSSEEFNKLLQEELKQYYLMERDWFDAFKNKKAMFGQWASDTVRAYDIRFGEETKLRQEFRKRR